MMKDGRMDARKDGKKERRKEGKIVWCGVVLGVRACLL